MMETGVQRGAPRPVSAQYATPATYRRRIDAALTLEATAAVEQACGYFGTAAPLRMPDTPEESWVRDRGLSEACLFIRKGSVHLLLLIL
jgi:hypothetical protein